MFERKQLFFQDYFPKIPIVTGLGLSHGSFSIILTNKLIGTLVSSAVFVINSHILSISQILFLFQLECYEIYKLFLFIFIKMLAMHIYSYSYLRDKIISLNTGCIEDDH